MTGVVTKEAPPPSPLDRPHVGIAGIKALREELEAAGEARLVKLLLLFVGRLGAHLKREKALGSGFHFHSICRRFDVALASEWVKGDARLVFAMVGRDYRGPVALRTPAAGLLFLTDESAGLQPDEPSRIERELAELFGGRI